MYYVVLCVCVCVKDEEAGVRADDGEVAVNCQQNDSAVKRYLFFFIHSEIMCQF